METPGERLARGDAAAFAELYDACADRLHHYLVVRLRSREDADDVLQETFVRLARQRKRLAKVENPIAYAFTVARNEALRLTHKRAQQREGNTKLAGEDLFAGRCDDQQARETADLVAVALGRLRVEEREIVELKTYAGLTFREIAEITGLPQGTAATRYRTAIERLRAWFAAEMT